MAGAGIALMTPMFWRRELAAGRLVQPFEHIYYAPGSYWLVYPEGRRVQPKIADFRRWLLAEADACRLGEPNEVFAEPPPLN